MVVEEYIEFVSERAIRVKGTRIGIETIVRDYQMGATPDEVILRYPTLSLLQVYAVLTYYLANQPMVEAYLERVRQSQEGAWQEQQQRPSEFVRSLRARLEQQRRLLSQSQAHMMAP
ncbi:DUF433 domain-containing protein [Nitrospiraceae bacterium AH_259_D15_M11_P09]|nr:DUF433 domain-containing protein [Nitrospiraceae bacterium AH_259_D15_M11_P09]